MDVVINKRKIRDTVKQMVDNGREKPETGNPESSGQYGFSGSVSD